MPRPKQKFDRVVMERLIREEGYTQKQCADHFKVSEASISKAVREVRLGTTTVANLEAGARVFKKQINTVDQMSKINEKANLILDGLMKEINDGGAVREKQKDLREIALKATAEIREQLKLQIEIMKTLHDVTAVAEFQKEVLNTIGEANKSPCCAEQVVCRGCSQKVDLRALIIEKLKQARALRSGVTFKP